MARIYVGTYAKYNNGNLFGAWLDLADYSDLEEFNAACTELHSDESDPELMFPDYEGFPRSMYSESCVTEALLEFAAMSEEDQEMFSVYLEDVDQGGTFEQAQEAFRGAYESKTDFAQSFHEETGGLQGVPEFWVGHIDWESVVRDMEHDGFTFVQHGGQVWVFVS